MRNSYLHEENQLDGRLGPQQLAEGVHEQVKGEQAELNQQHQRVVAGLERLRPEGGAPGRTVVVQWIQGCTTLAHTPHRNIKVLTVFRSYWCVQWLHSNPPHVDEVSLTNLHGLLKCFQNGKQSRVLWWASWKSQISTCHSSWVLQLQREQMWLHGRVSGVKTCGRKVFL